VDTHLEKENPARGEILAGNFLSGKFGVEQLPKTLSATF
jgi:hypothetical protein